MTKQSRDILTSSERTQRCYKLLSKLWALIVLSLPLDYLFLLYPNQQASAASIFLPYLNIFLLALLVLFHYREPLWSTLTKLNSWRETTKAYTERYTSTIIAVICAITLIEVLVKLGQFGFWAILAALVVSARAWYSMYHQQRALKKLKQTKDSQDNLRQIQLYQHLLVIHSLPILTSRALSLVAGLQFVLGDHSEFTFVIYNLAALVLLLSQKPERRNFETNCCVCAKPIARILEFKPKCSDCLEASEKQDAAKKAKSKTSKPLPASPSITPTLRSSPRSLLRKVLKLQRQPASDPVTS